MTRLLREPLFHFLVIAALIFAGTTLLSSDEISREESIVVPAGKIEHLAALFARTWQRTPTLEELEGLVDDHVREEAAYREGLALGLDRNDTIIRRRIRQKLDFIAEDLATSSEPTDEELAAWLAEHPDDFLVEVRLSFRQVFLNPTARGDRLGTDATELLLVLNGSPDGDAREAGDRTLLEHAHADLTLSGVRGILGPGFAEAIADLETGTWHGPIESGYGVHLVRIDARRDGRLPELDEVRNAVRREWSYARRAAAIEAFYADLLARYDVVVEWPETDNGAEP